MAKSLPASPALDIHFTPLGTAQSPAQYLTLAAFQAERAGQLGRYDVVQRRALDAAVVVPYFHRDGVLQVRLRTVVRPPLALRPAPHPSLSAPPAVLWELPAGLIDAGESPAEAAARELYEELGVHALELAPLGPANCPAPAVLGEMHVYFAARIDGDEVPASLPGDGSLYELAPQILSLSLDAALQACRQGEVLDAKTELGLRRLQDAAASLP